MSVAAKRIGPRRWRLTDASDGRVFQLRPLRVTDAPALQEAFLREAPEDRMMRLLSAIEALPDRMARRLCAIDESRDVGLVVTPEGADAPLLGGARLMRDRDPASAEFAVSVASAMKGRGFGRCALEAAFAVGREMGVARVWGSISARNAAMRALARSLGMTERRDPDDTGMILAELAL